MPFAAASSPIRSGGASTRSAPSSPSARVTPARGEQDAEPLGVGRAHPRRAGGAGEHVRDRRLPDETAPVDDDDAIRGLCDLREDVAGDEDRPSLRRERAEEITEPADSGGVEPVRGLVEHEHLVAEQGRGEAEPLAHAQRVALDAPLRRGRQLDQREHLVDPRGGDAGGGRLHAQVVAPGAARMHLARLEHCADTMERAVEAAVGARRARSRARRPDARARATERSVVDLPAPFGPRKRAVPGSTRKLRSATACVFPKRLASPSDLDHESAVT